MDLTPDDVRDIVRVLDSGGLDELHLELAELTLDLRRSGAAGGWTAEQQVRRAPVRVDESAPDAEGVASETAEPVADVPAGLVAVRPPLLGTFYRAPQPGAAPFVECGDPVEADTVVGVVETMKMMTPVAAGTRGTVAQIRAGNGEFVAADAVLLLVDPAP